MAAWIKMSCFGVFGAIRGTSARLRGLEGVELPLGMLVFAAVPAVWDFATSGLELGLLFGWLGGSWWVLNAAPLDRSRCTLAAAVLFGLGPLIRPDAAVFSLALILALLLRMPRPDVKRMLVVLGAAVAIPVAYQIFRMGYYGALVPNTAIAKEAGVAYWDRGWAYLRNGVGQYRLLIPLGALGFLVALECRRLRPTGRALVATSAVPVAGLLHLLWVVRLGGDFMHARFLIPGLFAILLPAASVVIPSATRAMALQAPFVAVITIWASLCATTMSVSASNTDGFIVERISMASVIFAEDGALISLEDLAAHPFARDAFWIQSATGDQVLIQVNVLNRMAFLGGPVEVHQAPPGSGVTYVAATIGMAGMAAGPDTRIIDAFGLADAIGARLELPEVRSEMAGHEKDTPLDWIFARAATTEAPSPGTLDAAAALQCGDLRELVEATTAPLTPRRFISNFVGSVPRTSLRIPRDPAIARAKFCE